MLCGLLLLATSEEQECEAVVGPGKCIVYVESATVIANGIVRAMRLGERNRHVLQDPKIVGVISECEAIGGERRIEVALPLQGERFVQVIEALRLDLPATAPFEEFPETHGQAQDKERR